MRRLSVALVALTAIASPAAALARPALDELQADAIARNVGLRDSDLPDYRSTPVPDAPKEDIYGNGRVAHCMGRTWFGKELADVTSPFFVNPDSVSLQLLASEVEVMPNASIVRKDLKKAGSARGRACLSKELRLGPGGDKDMKLVKSVVLPLSPRVTNGAGYRVKLTYRTRTRHTVKLTSDVLIFGDGPIEAALVTVSGKTPDRAQADQLLAAMRTRADEQLAQVGG